jgi:hypothetical protein
MSKPKVGLSGPAISLLQSTAANPLAPRRCTATWVLGSSTRRTWHWRCASALAEMLLGLPFLRGILHACAWCLLLVCVLVLQCRRPRSHMGRHPPDPLAPSTQALLLLARQHTALLARFGAFLASILDHLECFSDEQLRKVFEMFAALTSPTGKAPSNRPLRLHARHIRGVRWSRTQPAAGTSRKRYGLLPSRAAGGSGEGASGSGGSGFCQGGRFEDELHITLTKALAHSRWARWLADTPCACSRASLPSVSHQNPAHSLIQVSKPWPFGSLRPLPPAPSTSASASSAAWPCCGARRRHTLRRQTAAAGATPVRLRTGLFRLRCRASALHSPPCPRASRPAAPAVLAAALLEACTSRAMSMLRQCQSAPACMAYLLDRLADAVAAGVPELEAGGAEQAAAGQQQQQQQQEGGGAGARLPLPLAEWLHERVQVRPAPAGFVA